jgi:uncharacterized membrane protein
MKVTRYLFLALLLSVLFAAPALALPANTVLTVQLLSVTASGQLSPARSISVTTDANGKAEFTFPNVPTSDVVPFLLIRIVNGTTVTGNGSTVPGNGTTGTTGTNILRQSVIAAPPPHGTANFGLSEVTTCQATALLKAFSDSHGTNITLAAMNTIMIRSGAISDPDLLNTSPLTQAAAAAFESFLPAGNLPAFRANLVTAMRDFATTYKESVDVALIANDLNTANPVQDLLNKATSNQLEAAKRGDATALFLSDLIDAGVNAGIPPTLIHTAFTEAGKAVEALGSPVSSDVVTAILAAFSTGAEFCEVQAAMRNYTAAMPFMNVTTGTKQPQFANLTTAASRQGLQQFNNSVAQLNTAAATLADALAIILKPFELIFADPTVFPALPDITYAQSSLNLTLQSLLANFIANTTSSPGELSAIQATLASRMGGNVMSNFSTMRRQGIGSLLTSPTASPQNWLTMMVAGANYVSPSLQLTYSSSINSVLAANLLAANVPVPTPPQYSLFSNPYKSLFRLQFDLMLLKFNGQQALAQASQPITQAALATIKGNDLAMRNTMLQNITITGAGNGASLANAFMIILAQPELL